MAQPGRTEVYQDRMRRDYSRRRYLDEIPRQEAHGRFRFCTKVTQNGEVEVWCTMNYYRPLEEDVLLGL